MEGAQLWGRAWFPTTPCVDTGTSLNLSGGLDFSLLCNGHDGTVARIYAQSKFDSKGEEPDMSRSAPRLEELREWCPPLNSEDPGGVSGSQDSPASHFSVRIQLDHVLYLFIYLFGSCALKQQSQTCLAPPTSFMEDNFSTAQGCRGWFRDDSST